MDVWLEFFKSAIEGSPHSMPAQEAVNRAERIADMATQRVLARRPDLHCVDLPRPAVIGPCGSGHRCIDG